MNTTKIALEASLKKLLKRNLLIRSVADLTEDCGIGRMAFTIISRISMIWWSGHVWKTAKKPLRDKKTRYLAGGLPRSLSSARKQAVIMNVYHSVRREKDRSFLYKLTYQLIADVVEKNSQRSSAGNR